MATLTRHDHPAIFERSCLANVGRLLPIFTWNNSVHTNDSCTNIYLTMNISGLLTSCICIYGGPSVHCNFMRFGPVNRLFTGSTYHKNLLTCFTAFLILKSDVTAFYDAVQQGVIWTLSRISYTPRLDLHSRLRCLDCKTRKHTSCDQTKSLLSSGVIRGLRKGGIT